MSERREPPEQSMEEILASIRRIISDDGAKAPAPSAGERAPPAKVEPVIPIPLGPVPDVADTPPKADPPRASQDEPLRVEPLRIERRSRRKVAAREDVLELTEVYKPGILPDADDRNEPQPPLVSSDAAAEAAAAFAAIGRAGQAAAAAEFGSLVVGSGRTVEELLQDMLRPMLKEWLDSRLPALVEAVVREEIERIVRRSNLR